MKKSGKKEKSVRRVNRWAPLRSVNAVEASWVLEGFVVLSVSEHLMRGLHPVEGQEEGGSRWMGWERGQEKNPSRQ